MTQRQSRPHTAGRYPARPYPAFFCRIISHAFVPFDVQPTSSSSLLACIRRFVCFSRGSSAHASKIRILPCLIFIYCFPPAFSILCRLMDYILFLHIQRVRASGYPCFFPHIYRQFSTIPHFFCRMSGFLSVGHGFRTSLRNHIISLSKPHFGAFALA